MAQTTTTRLPAPATAVPAGPASGDVPDLSGEPLGRLIKAQWRRDCLTAHLLGIPKETMMAKLTQMQQQMEAIYAAPRP